MTALGLKQDDSGQPPAKRAVILQEDDDEMEQNFTCGICQDIIYKCVALIPCLHSFCCSCVSDWLERSTDCPECRKKIKGVWILIFLKMEEEQEGNIDSELLLSLGEQATHDPEHD